MQIPSSFKLLGHTITVEEELTGMYEKGRYGCSGFETKFIRITPKGPQHPVTETSIEHTFLHELVHHILYYSDLAADVKSGARLCDQEAFVDLFAGLLHQALTTMEYP